MLHSKQAPDQGLDPLMLQPRQRNLNPLHNPLPQFFSLTQDINSHWRKQRLLKPNHTPLRPFFCALPTAKNLPMRTRNLQPAGPSPIPLPRCQLPFLPRGGVSSIDPVYGFDSLGREGLVCYYIV